MRKSDLATLGFAAFSLLGTLSLSYYCLVGLPENSAAPIVDEAPVYQATAVPLDSIGADGRTVPARQLFGQTSTKARPNPRSHADGPNVATPVHAPVSVVADAGQSPDPLPQSLITFPNLTRSPLPPSLPAGLPSGGTGSATQGNTAGYAEPDAFAAVVEPVPEPAAWGWLALGAALLIGWRQLRPPDRARCRLPRHSNSRSRGS